MRLVPMAGQLPPPVYRTRSARRCRMNPLRKLTILLALVGMTQSRLCAQEFSPSPEYKRFYESRFDGKFYTEDTIAIWWLIEKFSDTDWSRQRLHDELMRFTKSYPESKKHVARANWHIDTLARMLGETRPAEDKMIERLVFDLRDVNVIQFSQPSLGLSVATSTGSDGMSLQNVLAGVERYSPNAAQKLVDIGYDSVPNLIDHLDDKTLTRSVHYWRLSVYGHNILTVGDCCKQILDLIVEPGRIFVLGDDPAKTKEAMQFYYRQRIEHAKKNAEP